jgi:hypothetical protein
MSRNLREKYMFITIRLTNTDQFRKSQVEFTFKFSRANRHGALEVASVGGEA